MPAWCSAASMAIPSSAATRRACTASAEACKSYVRKAVRGPFIFNGREGSFICTCAHYMFPLKAVCVMTIGSPPDVQHLHQNF